MTGNNISKPTSTFAEMQRQWELPDALMSGANALKNQEWLPKEPAESEKNYEIRKRRSHLFNAFKKTVQQNVGKVFAKDIVVDEDIHPLLALMLDNVDMEGRDINQFAKGVFQDGLVRGLSAIFVDYSITEPAETRREELGARPYWVHLDASQILDVRSSIIGGRERPSFLRFKETIRDWDDEWQEINIQQVKVFSMRDDGVIEWFAYRRKRTQADVGLSQDPWQLHDGGEISGVPYIPVIPFYAERTGFFTAEPPLLELAQTNLTHFRSMSDQRNILHIARVPMLKYRGDPGVDPETGEERQIVISPNTVLNLGNDPNADAEWIEHKGTAIEAGRQDLKDLEDQMAVQGLELTVSRPGGQTATEKSIDTAAANSLLKSMALNLKDALEQALQISAIYLDIPLENSGSLEVNTDYTVSYEGDKDMKSVMEMYRSNLVDASTVIGEAKRREILHPETELQETRGENRNPDVQE